VWSRPALPTLIFVSLGLLGCDAAEVDSPAPSASDGGHDHDAHSHPAPVDEIDLDASVVPVDGSTLGEFKWQLPFERWPLPVVPADNPMSNEKVELGRHLFYDVRLSKNETQSCASCHKQELAFTDGRAVGLGSTGELHSRGSMSLANVAYAQSLTWANPVMLTLERQAHVPIFGDRPIELGQSAIPELEERLRVVARYEELFAAAFPDQPEPFTTLNVERSLAAFQRVLISGNSAYDRYVAGESAALSDAAKRGMIFITTNEDHRFECNHCHGGLLFSDHVTWQGRSNRGEALLYHQTGLYDIDGEGSYPEPNTGAFDVTLDPADMGKFKVPTLRNIALTAPYMHDGSIKTLSEVLDHYSKGGRAHVTGKTDSLLKPFTITEEEKVDVIAFLNSLTDETFIRDPRSRILGSKRVPRPPGARG
jgi:cytochrome c peroxidase